MHYNRLFSEMPERRLSDPTPSPAAFLLFPLVFSPLAAQHQFALYEWALNQAKAVVRPSVLERDLLAVWN
jgi:hypothetical protein